jgi:hypothetical protein
LRSDGRLDTCVAIVQCAVSVEASSSTGASSGTADAVVVVSSHSIGSGLRIIARANTSSNLDAVGELYTEDAFRQLVVAIEATPVFFQQFRRA